MKSKTIECPPCLPCHTLHHHIPHQVAPSCVDPISQSSHRHLWGPQICPTSPPIGTLGTAIIKSTRRESYRWKRNVGDNRTTNRLISCCVTRLCWPAESGDTYPLSLRVSLYGYANIYPSVLCGLPTGASCCYPMTPYPTLSLDHSTQLQPLRVVP